LVTVIHDHHIGASGLGRFCAGQAVLRYPEREVLRQHQGFIPDHGRIVIVRINLQGANGAAAMAPGQAMGLDLGLGQAQQNFAHHRRLTCAAQRQITYANHRNPRIAGPAMANLPGRDRRPQPSQRQEQKPAERRTLAHIPPAGR
jgi:hypothetical protein